MGFKEDIDKVRQEFDKKQKDFKEELTDGVITQQKYIYQEISNFHKTIESFKAMIEKLSTDLKGEKSGMNPGAIPTIKAQGIAIQKNTDFRKRLGYYAAGFSCATVAIIEFIVWSWKTLFKA